MEDLKENNSNLKASIKINGETINGVNFVRPMNTEVVGVMPMSVITVLTEVLQGVNFEKIKHAYPSY